MSKAFQTHYKINMNMHYKKPICKFINRNSGLVISCTDLKWFFYFRFGPINPVKPCHFLLKCLYQARKVSGHVR